VLNIDAGSQIGTIFPSGEPDKRSGIRPALLNFRILDFLNRDAKVQVSLERPLKVNANVALAKQLIDVSGSIHNAAGIDEIVRSDCIVVS
jgi:hypothetical protein